MQKLFTKLMMDVRTGTQAFLVPAVSVEEGFAVALVDLAVAVG